MTESKPEYVANGVAKRELEETLVSVGYLKRIDSLEFTPGALEGLQIMSVEMLPMEISLLIKEYLLMRGLDESGQEHRVIIAGATATKPCPAVMDMVNNFEGPYPFFTLEELLARLRNEPLAEVTDG